MNIKTEAPINIKDLVLEDIVPESVSFDPNTEIPEEIWLQALDQIKTKAYSSPDYDRFLRDAVIIAPEKVAGLNLEEPDWEELYQGVDNIHIKSQRRRLILMASALSYVFPDAVEKMHLSGETWEEIKESFKVPFGSELFADSTLDTAAFFPDRVNGLHYPEEADQLTDLLAIYSKRDNPYKLARVLAELKVRFPNLYTKPSKSNWNFMKDELDRINRSGILMVGIMEFSRHLAIVAADKVEVGRSSIKLTSLHKDFAPIMTPELPETRRY